MINQVEAEFEELGFPFSAYYKKWKRDKIQKKIPTSK
jgi:hypothetical protein